ncbi:MAG: HlyD family type I secretion periplasmic adaptor subunit [Rhodospirillales bacterium]|nr:HlyD family type I secretion periplasmic adaptor subunit [Rhodospirillales bacterium]
MAQELSQDANVGRNTHFLLALCVGTCLAFFGWASVSTLDIVSLVSGEVIPSSQVKSIQHLEGGIVREISVREGEEVKQGQNLITLEPTQSGADVGEIKVRLLSLRAEIARLEAEVSGAETPVFDEDLMKNNPRMVKQTLVRFSSRKKAKQSRIDSQRETITQRRQEINEINARIRNLTNNLKLMQEQIAISDDLLKEDLTNRYNHLDLLKEASNLQGRKEEDAAALKRAKSALKEAESNMEGIHTAFLEEAGKELEDARLSFNELSQREQKFEDNLARTILRSPVDGVIKTLHASTVGGVLKPGETVIDIVPADDRLIIEAWLPTEEIGYVHEGQTALIKLNSADAMRFGTLDGRVTRVSPDTLVTEEGIPYYKVRIETDSDRFQKGALQYRLFPGMRVFTSIRTGERTVMEYLTSPFLTTMSGAMGER